MTIMFSYILAVAKAESGLTYYKTLLNVKTEIATHIVRISDLRQQVNMKVIEKK